MEGRQRGGDFERTRERELMQGMSWESQRASTEMGGEEIKVEG